jgi:hypothetical protein
MFRKKEGSPVAGSSEARGDGLERKPSSYPEGIKSLGKATAGVSGGSKRISKQDPASSGSDCQAEGSPVFR